MAAAVCMTRSVLIVRQLNRATEISIENQNNQARTAIQAADQEIARFRALMQQIDDLEMEFDKLKRIREIVRQYRARVEQMERRLG